MADETSLTPAGNTPERKPATLPAQSRAAAAQRLNDIPQRPMRGVHYTAPQRSTHPVGWRTRRYLKRKHLRRSNLHVARMERVGTQITLLPMALGTLVIFLVMSSVLVGAVALVNATTERFGADVVTLDDILPKDSLKIYDDHGTVVYQMVKNGLQTTVAMGQSVRYLINGDIA